MPASYILVSCDSYKNSIHSGFSRLQEQQEFVDLTLAADGHFVKVHKNVIALASPYLKAMVLSASSQSPVIFLNNVSYNILIYLLEYIYQGEVSVPEDAIESFLQVAISLNITGMDGVNATKPNQKSSTPINNPIITLDGDAEHCSNETEVQPQLENQIITTDTHCSESHIMQETETQPNLTNPIIPVNVPAEIDLPSNFAARITINSDRNLEVEQFIENMEPIELEANKFQGSLPIIEDLNKNEEELVNDNDDNMEIDNSGTQKENMNTFTLNSETLDRESKDALKMISQFSVTQRGAVQIIVNRYIYGCHHSSRKGRKRRWRCVDYRALHCPAYIDSFDGRIILRKGVHNHAFHDGIIYRKHRQHKIYHSLKQAEESRNYSKENDSDVDAENAIEFSVIPVNTSEQ